MKTSFRALLAWFAVTNMFILPAAAQPAKESPQPAGAAPRPGVVILATGGTIVSSTRSPTDMANYSGPLAGVDSLLKAVPQIHNYANVRAEQIVNVGSNVITSENILNLAKRVNAVLAEPDVAGVVVTHGTDTMEETAYFLSLATRSSKPIVVTGSMRPATSLGADGPVNLLDAVMVAADPASRDRGVMVVMNDRISAARYVTKMNTLNVDAMGSVEQGYLGAVAGERVIYYYEPARAKGELYFDVSGVTRLPHVELVYRYQGQEMQLVRDAVNEGAQGVVIGFTGNGNASPDHEALIREFGGKGIPIVRGSRVVSGIVTPKVSGSMAAGALTAAKARILLMLALTRTKDIRQISDFFAQQ
ncbi:asparaginase [Cupriavidus oxalaticus]|uniref:asparaginase n=1 Tax=Cupriavidus oxalaticus TaxID=96344 RepID=UPI003180350E